MSIRKDNLKRLADYLNNLPDDYDQFSMTLYATGITEPKQLLSNWNNKTCGCVIAHAIIMGIEVIEEDKTWHDFALRTLFKNASEMLWISGTCWQYIDNSHKGAAKRIYEFLENGVPENSVWQQSMKVDYMFKEG